MNENNFDLIIFDWDGTLANSTQLIIDAICQASADVGLNVPAQSAASGIIGLGLREALIELFGMVPEDKIQQLMARYAHYYGCGENNIPLFEGAADAVRELHQRGIALGVATGKGRGGLNRALKNSGIGEFFAATRCVDECHSKPHPQMILEIMEEVDVAPERTLMIGDTSFDLQMAENAGVRSIGVSYGAHPLERLLAHQPIAHFDEFTKLKQWLIMNV